jgi:hypothetical protein
MEDIYIGSTYRKQREFMNAGVLADLTALTVTIKQEAGGGYLTTTAEGEFHDKNILANKISTGKYFTRVTPDAAEATGVYLLYWTATYGTGGTAETFIAGPDVLCIHSEADIPALTDNYVSLDAISKEFSDLFNLEPPAHVLKTGWIVSRDIDAVLDERFDVPVKKNTSGVYDQPILDAAVWLTIERVLRKYGRGEQADEWGKRGSKVCDDLLEGRKRLSSEVTKDEVGFGPPHPAAANTSTNIELQIHHGAAYAGVYQRKIVIQIDGAGAVGTATFKYSLDAGNTWEETLIATSEEWISRGSAQGLVIRFMQLGTGAALVSGDSWTIEAYPADTPVATSKRGIRTAALNL